jgi:hypothetical protein
MQSYLILGIINLLQIQMSVKKQSKKDENICLQLLNSLEMSYKL